MPSAACCPCGQLVGCVCGAGPACILTCERKAGSAELCGFPEFVPSSPPRFYKRRRTTGLMTILAYADSLCGAVVAVPASLECRSKSGTATLIGVPEFINPSIPRRTYRRHAWSGSTTQNNQGACTEPIFTRTWSGELAYNRTTGATTDSRCFQLNGGLCSTWPCGPSSVPTFNEFNGCTDSHANNPNECCAATLPSACFTTCTQTESQAVGRGLCVGCGGPTGAQQISGQGVGLLSDEDLPGDAVDRAKAAIGAWIVGTCPDSSSFQTPRTDAAFSFTFRAGQARAVITGGLIPGDNYEIRIHVEKRAVGTSDPFVDSGNDIIAAFTAAGVAFTSDWQDLPSDPQNEYRASGVTVSHNVEAIFEDNWNLDEDFAPSLPAICAPTVVSDTSFRTVDGVPVAWPFDGTIPPDAYGALAPASAEPTTRLTEGTDACTDTGGGVFKKASGTVSEELSNEDTEQDAIDRATAAAAWAPCAGGCTVGCTAFETLRGTGAVFGFAIVRTRAAWTAVIGANYKVTIRFASRVLGTGGPFLFYALTETVVTADAINELTGWFDVPREPGLEVIAANCSIELLP